MRFGFLFGNTCNANHLNILAVEGGELEGFNIDVVEAPHIEGDARSPVLAGGAADRLNAAGSAK